ncbi:septal ring lytic transglycosylase RlpA family protein [Pleurocapsales cyanobacterium LEGE 06147]|nr:septal ring lytic transglycosylase RlpA family protein [Pleurocapsales cyanobacterium LEGE 06147]
MNVKAKANPTIINSKKVVDSHIYTIKKRLKSNYKTQLVGNNLVPFSGKGRISPPVQVAHAVTGEASWYGPGFHGRTTANGEKFNQEELTAAHRSLPFGTKVRVTNINNGRSVVVRINDRGPFAAGRVIDLSAAAARVIGMLGSGIAPVQLEILE